MTSHLGAPDDLPLYNQDNDGTLPAEVTRLKTTIGHAKRPVVCY